MQDFIKCKLIFIKSSSNLTIVLMEVVTVSFLHRPEYFKEGYSSTKV